MSSHHGEYSQARDEALRLLDRYWFSSIGLYLGPALLLEKLQQPVRHGRNLNILGTVAILEVVAIAEQLVGVLTGNDRLTVPAEFKMRIILTVLGGEILGGKARPTFFRHPVETLVMAIAP